MNTLIVKDKRHDSDHIIYRLDNISIHGSLKGIAELCRFLRSNEKIALVIPDMRHADGARPQLKEIAEISRRVVQVAPFSYRRQFLVNERDGYIVVPVGDISYISTEAGVVSLYLKSRKQHPVYMSLDDIENQLDPMLFFRATRQHIINVSSVLRISKWFNRKLKVILSEYPDTDIVVCKEKATRLKQWLDC